MNRRGFLGSLVALAVAPFVPMPPPVARPQLLFHKDAFALVMEPMTGLFNPPPVRFDVLYGAGIIRPNLMCRIIA